MTDWLWAELHDLFDTDDGSLPEVRVDFADKQAVIAAFAELRSRGQDAANGGATFWSIAHSEACPLSSVPNAAELVVSGEAEPFHLLLRGIDIGGVRLPDLGVFVFDDEIAIDYHMGPQWGPNEVRGLFQVLLELSRLDPESSLALEPGVAREVVERFMR